MYFFCGRIFRRQIILVSVRLVRFSSVFFMTNCPTVKNPRAIFFICSAKSFNAKIPTIWKISYHIIDWFVYSFIRFLIFPCLNHGYSIEHKYTGIISRLIRRTLFRNRDYFTWAFNDAYNAYLINAFVHTFLHG